MEGRDGPSRIGCTGWAIPASSADAFPATGSHLARYAARFAAVEISSSFHRHHRPDTYARWAATVPPGFRFAVKLPRAITHDAHLGTDGLPALDRFLAEVARLGDRLGPLLVQLPPGLSFDAARATAFFVALAARTPAAIACEPRHPSWFTGAGDALLAELRVARVAADPAIVPAAGLPGGWVGLAYHRLHGSPAVYRSPYPDAALAALATALRREADAPVWCFFDNSATGAAPRDALALAALLSRP
jgi:uncharacterized protein YecE (DUF72 family)